jgi:hypothetical protein
VRIAETFRRRKDLPRKGWVLTETLDHGTADFTCENYAADGPNKAGCGRLYRGWLASAGALLHRICAWGDVAFEVLDCLGYIKFTTVK